MKELRASASSRGGARPGSGLLLSPDEESRPTVAPRLPQFAALLCLLPGRAGLPTKASHRRLGDCVSFAVSPRTGFAKRMRVYRRFEYR